MRLWAKVAVFVPLIGLAGFIAGRVPVGEVITPEESDAVHFWGGMVELRRYAAHGLRSDLQGRVIFLAASRDSLERRLRELNLVAQEKKSILVKLNLEERTRNVLNCSSLISAREIEDRLKELAHTDKEFELLHFNRWLKGAEEAVQMRSKEVSELLKTVADENRRPGRSDTWTLETRLAMR